MNLNMKRINEINKITHTAQENLDFLSEFC